MKSCLLAALCAFAFSLGLTSTASAVLVSVLSGQAVYDTDLDITWLADANANVGSAFDDSTSASCSWPVLLDSINGLEQPGD